MIINSLVDTDLYKFTMMQAVLHHFPAAMVEYRFKCRTPGIDLRPYAEKIRQQVKHLCSLRMQEEELEYLAGLRYIKSDFIDFLRIFQLNEKFIEIRVDENDEADENFAIIIRGPWLHTILFEVPVLAIVNETYFATNHPQANYAEGEKLLAEKVSLIKNTESHEDIKSFRFSEFGTRRRFSAAWQEHVVKTLSQELTPYMAGTSNVLLAKKFNLIPIGTMAHEYVQACQSLGPRLLYSQKYAFEVWAQEYRGDLGIALSDTYGTDAFIRDFDLYFCKLFDGARQDSGDPFVWGEKVLKHYKAMRVDAKTKTFVFSDSLNFSRALDLYRHFKDRAQLAFGIGTNLTNDLGYKTLDIVIKMVECNGQPVAKISEEPGKTMCRDDSYLNYLRKVFRMEE